MKGNQKKIFKRERRHRRVRGKVSGTSDRPRLTVFRSHKNIYAQIIDDEQGRTLISASSRDRGLADDVGYGGNQDAAKKVGEVLAAKAVEAGITAVVFDRGGYKYHGRVKQLAEAARAAGLKF